MDMNSCTSLLLPTGLNSGLLSVVVGIPFPLPSSADELKLNATNRVYNHPIFKQNLLSSKSPQQRKRKGTQLAKNPPKLPPGLSRPPVPRHNTRPNHANRNSRTPMKRNFYHRHLLQPYIIPAPNHSTVRPSIKRRRTNTNKSNYKSTTQTSQKLHTLAQSQSNKNTVSKRKSQTQRAQSGFQDINSIWQ
jgi:hypothetical protein